MGTAAGSWRWSCDRRTRNGLDAAPGLQLHEHGDGVLRLVGDIDAATAPELERRLGQRPIVLVLDARDVTFIDAAGLGALLRAQRSSGCGFALRAPSTPVRRVLELAGLTGWLCVEHAPSTTAARLTPPPAHRAPASADPSALIAPATEHSAGRAGRRRPT